MKVLIACGRDTWANPYVSTLADGLINHGGDVVCSLDEFWQNPLKYDIVHLQWPDLFVSKMGQNGELLIKNLELIKSNEIPIFATLHNIVPHSLENGDLRKVYDIVFNYVDVFIHLGNFSVGIFHEKYPYLNAKHYVIPHHTFDSIYNMNVDPVNAKKKLNIPDNIKCVLSFGGFRNHQERKLILDFARKYKDVYYLMPGFYRSPIKGRTFFMKIPVLIKHLYYSLVAKIHNIHIEHRYIPDEELPLYLKAADVLVIQRLRILNSGNVPLAMLAGIPIVGPDDGNVGELLRLTNNFTFNPNDIDSLVENVKSALRETSLGRKNREYAEAYLTTEKISGDLYRLYSFMLNV